MEAICYTCKAILNCLEVDLTIKFLNMLHQHKLDDDDDDAYTSDHDCSLTGDLHDGNVVS